MLDEAAAKNSVTPLLSWAVMMPGLRPTPVQIGTVMPTLATSANPSSSSTPNPTRTPTPTPRDLFAEGPTDRVESVAATVIPWVETALPRADATKPASPAQALTMSVFGEGEASFSVLLTYVPPAPFAQALSRGIIVEKVVRRLRMHTSEHSKSDGHILTHNDDQVHLSAGFAADVSPSAQALHEIPEVLPEGAPITAAAVGESLLVTVQFTLARDLDRVDVLDWLPAGLEPVNAHLPMCTLVHSDGTLSAAFQRYFHQSDAIHHHDPHSTHAAYKGQLAATPVFRRFVSADRIRWQSVGMVSKGTYSFTFAVLAVTPGSFLLPAAMVTCAAVPEIMGMSLEGRFEVSIA